MARLVHFLTQAWTPPADLTTSFTGKTIVITGANTGLGFEAALKIYALGTECVVMGVRDIAKGEAAKAEVEKRCSGVEGAGQEGVVRRIEVWKCDMDDYSSILRFVEKVNALEKLDGVVLNAGIFGVSYKLGNYSWEEVLQVNVLSTALLGILLLPKLKASRRLHERLPVLEFVSSDGHELVTIPEEKRKAQNLLQTYNSRESSNPRTQYQTSKLFVMYVMQTLADLAKGLHGKAEVVVLAVCPGGEKSDLSRGYEGVVARVFKWVFGALFLRSMEQGGRTLVSGLLLGEEENGRFWQSDVIREPAPLVSGEEGEQLRRRVWGEIVEALGKDVLRVEEVLSELNVS